MALSAQLHFALGWQSEIALLFLKTAKNIVEIFIAWSRSVSGGSLFYPEIDGDQSGPQYIRSQKFKKKKKITNSLFFHFPGENLCRVFCSFLLQNGSLGGSKLMPRNSSILATCIFTRTCTGWYTSFKLPFILMLCIIGFLI